MIGVFQANRQHVKEIESTKVHRNSSMYSATISRQQASGWNRRRTISILGGQRPWRGKAGQTSSGSLPTERRPNRHLRLGNYVKQSAFRVLSSGDDATPKRCSLNLNQNPLARSSDGTTEPKKSNHEFSYFPNVLIFPERLRGGGSKVGFQFPEIDRPTCRGASDDYSRTNRRRYGERNYSQREEPPRQQFGSCRRCEEDNSKIRSLNPGTNVYYKRNERYYYRAQFPSDYEPRPCDKQEPDKGDDDKGDDDDDDDDDERKTGKAGCCPCNGCGGPDCEDDEPKTRPKSNYHSGDVKSGENGNCCGQNKKSGNPCNCKCQTCKAEPRRGGCGGAACGRLYSCSGVGGGTCCFPRNTRRRSGPECCGGGKGCGGCC